MNIVWKNSLGSLVRLVNLMEWSLRGKPHMSYSEGHSVKNVRRIRLENVTLCIKLAKTLVGLDWIRLFR